MPALEKAWALSYLELRLLARKSANLAVLLLLPIAGALFFGMAGRNSSDSLSPYGLSVILPASSLLLSYLLGLGTQVRKTQTASDAARIGYPSWLLAALIILIAQSMLYTAFVGVLDPGSAPRTGTIAWSIILSLIPGFVIRVWNSRAWV